MAVPHSISRRTFINAAALAATFAATRIGFGETDPRPKRRIVVGAHPWVYAAKQPNYDLTPQLPQIFADFHYAGVDGIELMHNALLPDEAVIRIRELSERNQLPVIGTSFNGAMWDREQHALVLATAEKVITRLSQSGAALLELRLVPCEERPQKHSRHRNSSTLKPTVCGKSSHCARAREWCSTCTTTPMRWRAICMIFMGRSSEFRT